jgi:integrase
MPKYRGVLKRKSLWYYRIQHDGRRIESRGFKTADDAYRARTKQLEKLLSRDLVHHNVTLAEFINVYMAEYGSVSVREGTYLSTRSLLMKHIVPVIGGIKLRDLKTYHVIQLQNDLVKTSAPSIARNAMMALRKVLRKAVEWEYIDHSPLKGKIPQAQSDEYPVLELGQLFALVERLQGRDKAIVALAGFAGLRRGEIFGLRWDDIDFKAGSIKLSRQFIRGKFAPLKTDKSRVTIPVWSRLTRILMEWRLQCGSPDLLFAGRNGKPLSGQFWNQTRWREIKKENGLPPRLRVHDLRHTFASILLSIGAAPGDVQKLLRHASYNTTMDIYRHIMPGQLERIFELLNLRSGEQNGEPKTQVNK